MCHRPLQNPLNPYLAEIPGMSHHCCWLEEDRSNYYSSRHPMMTSMTSSKVISVMMISMTTSMTMISMTMISMISMISMMTSMMVSTSVATALTLHSSFLSV